jgi:hypothetical protein
LARDLQALAGPASKEETEYLKATVELIEDYAEAPAAGEGFRALQTVWRLTAGLLGQLHTLGKDPPKLAPLEKRLAELNQQADALGVKRNLDDDGLIGTPRGVFVFALESVGEVEEEKPADTEAPADDLGINLPGMNPAALAALRAQKQLLAAAERTTDPTLKNFLVMAASAETHLDLVQSISPAYYAGLATQYHLIKAECDGYRREEARLWEEYQQAEPPEDERILAEIAKVEAQLDQVLDRLNRVLLLALGKIIPTGPPDRYIPILGNGPAPPEPEAAKLPRLARVTLLNRTGIEIVACLSGDLTHLPPGGQVTVKVTPGGCALSVRGVPRSDPPEVAPGGAFLTAAEGKHYVVSVSLARKSE